MYPLDNVWTNCLKNLNVSSMYPLGKCPLAPSESLGSSDPHNPPQSRRYYPVDPRSPGPTDKASCLPYDQQSYLRNKTRRLTMVTSYQPIPTVVPITEGVIRRAADAATGRVVDGVCRHRHDGKKGNGEVVKDRP